MAVLTFCVESTNYASNIQFEVWLDQKCIHSDKITNPITISHKISNNPGCCQLKIVMQGKGATDTVIDKDGNIVADTVVKVTDFMVDANPIDQIVHNQAVYWHNFNSSGPETQESFYGNMGCNGNVILEFTAPVYLWLLEHM